MSAATLAIFQASCFSRGSCSFEGYTLTGWIFILGVIEKLFFSSVLVTQFVKKWFPDQALAFRKTRYQLAGLIHPSTRLQLFQGRLHSRDGPLESNVCIQHQAEAHPCQLVLC